MLKSASAGGHVVLKSAGSAVLLGLSAIPAYFAGGLYGYLPCLSLLALYILSALYLLVLKNSVCFEAEAADTVCGRGDLVRTVIRINNNSRLPCMKLRTELYVDGFLPEEDTVISETISLGAKRSTEFVIASEMKHIGVYGAGIRNLRVYDLTGVFFINIRGGRNFRITVLPKVSGSQRIWLDQQHLTESQNVQKTAVSDGFDYTGVREYALGDSMKRVHWKLSAHSSAYMTKITESSRRSDLAVMIDLAATIDPASITGLAASIGSAAMSRERKSLPDIYDCLIETALSLIEQAEARDVECSLLFVGRDKELVRVCPKGEKDYPELIRMLPFLFCEKNTKAMDGAGILTQEKHLGNRSNNLILCTSQVTESLAWELIQAKKQQRNPELYYILPPKPAGETGHNKNTEDMHNESSVKHKETPMNHNNPVYHKSRSIFERLDEQGIRYQFISSQSGDCQK